MKHLFVVAHPDDEILGAGAYIYDRARAGDEVGVMVLNTCDTTRYDENRSKIVDDLRASQKLVGVKRRWLTNYLDSNFHNADHREMVQAIEQVIRDFQPDRLYTQHPGDINTDHYWTAASCMEAFRLWQRCREDVNPIEALYLMEVQSSTDWALNPSLKKFDPNTFVEVTEEAVYRKLMALEAYENVIRERPHPRSQEAILSLPLLRGGQAGCHYAEAFECVFRRESL